MDDVEETADALTGRDVMDAEEDALAAEPTKRKRRTVRGGQGPLFDIEIPGVERHECRHRGEDMALVEAQNAGVEMTEPGVVRVMDEDTCIWYIVRDEDGAVLTYPGYAAPNGGKA